MHPRKESFKLRPKLCWLPETAGRKLHSMPEKYPNLQWPQKLVREFQISTKYISAFEEYLIFKVIKTYIALTFLYYL